jgi:hypothetical protein
MLNATLPLIPTPTPTTHDSFAIADSGATSNFLNTTDAAVINVKPAEKPLIVRIPNGKQLHSTHVCELTCPNYHTTQGRATLSQE